MDSSDVASLSQLEQLKLLKFQTQMTGGLHEAQVLQLKIWPRLIFPEATGSSFTWDPEGKTLGFTLNLPPKLRKPRKYWEQGVEILQSWVHELLGGEWVIGIQAGKKTYCGGYRIDTE